MATRGQLRDELRRRLQDVVEEQWDDDTVLDALLNSGLRYMQKEVLKIDPEAFFEVATAHLVSGQALYEKPTNMVHEMSLALKDTGTGQYNRIERKAYYQVVNRESGSQSIYCHHGAFFLIGPTPGSSVSAGIQLTHCPILSMADDADVPVLNINLHEGIYLDAELLARGHSPEGKSSSYEESKEMLSLVVNNIPLFYKKSAADPISIDLSQSFHKDPY